MNQKVLFIIIQKQTMLQKKISKKDSIKEAKKYESKESLNGKMSFLKGNVKIAKKKK